MIGQFKATAICKDRNGNEISIDEIKPEDTGGIKPVNIYKKNLVLNGGRKTQAESLGGREQRSGGDAKYVNRIILGIGPKQSNAPHLANTTDTISQIKKIDDTPFGIFTIFDEDIHYPDSVARIPAGLDSGWATDFAELQADGTFIQESPASDNFEDALLTDQVTLDRTDGTRLSIKEIVSSSEMKLHNPSGLEFTGRYRVDSSGTQVVFSKLIEGNTFHPDEFGQSVLVQESGLLFNDSTLYNRVIYGEEGEDTGIILQSDQSSSGIEISYRFEFTITM